MNTINEKDKDTTYDYGCLMVKIDLNELPELAKKVIKEEDIYNDDDNSYGIETEPHVTILYGLHDDIDHDKILRFCKMLKSVSVTLSDISLFENEYDVLKFDIKSDDLTLLNEIIKNNFEHTSNYPDYHPHLTIAYLKKGTGKNYIDNEAFKEFLTVETGKVFYYSKANGEKYFINTESGLITKTKKGSDNKEFIFLSEDDLINYNRMSQLNDIKVINTDTDIDDKDIDDKDTDDVIKEKINSIISDIVENKYLNINLLSNISNKMLHESINNTYVFPNNIGIKFLNENLKIDKDITLEQLLEIKSKYYIVDIVNNYIIDEINEEINITEALERVKKLCN